MFWTMPLIIFVVLLFLATLYHAFPITPFYFFRLTGFFKVIFFLTFYYSVVYSFLFIAGWIASGLFSSFLPSVKTYGMIALVVVSIIAGFTTLQKVITGIGYALIPNANGPPEAVFVGPINVLDDMLQNVTKPVRARVFLSYNATRQFSREKTLMDDVEAVRAVAKDYRELGMQSMSDWDIERYLVESKTKDPQALRDIAAVLKSPGWSHRVDTCRLLVELNADLPDIMEALMEVAANDPEEDVRIRASNALCVIAPEEKWLEEFALRKIESGNPVGVQILHFLSDNDTRVEQAFDRYLKDKRPEIRNAWVSVKSAEGPPCSGSGIPILSILWEDEDIKSSIKSAVLKLMKDPDASIRLAAATVITYSWTARNNPTTARAFEEVLQDPLVLHPLVSCPIDDIRRAASGFVEEHENMFKNKKFQLSVLATIREDPSHVYGMGQSLARALKSTKTASPEVMKEIIAMLKDENYHFCTSAAQILEDMTVDDPKIQMLLVRQLTDRNDPEHAHENVRWKLGSALENIITFSPAVKKELTKLAIGNDEELARIAQRALKIKEDD